MKTSKFLFENKSKVEIWYEEINGQTDYWKKVDGISYSITKRQFDNLSKKADEKAG